MPKRLRFQPSRDMIHVVSMRCMQGFSFLKPSQTMNLVTAGVLGRALAYFESSIKLYAYVFMSNHYHMIIQAEDHQALSKFMQYFNQNLSRELSHLHEWKHHFWQTSYSSHLVLDEEALVSQFKYVLSNSVKEGLVNHPQLWPGLHCYSQIVERKKVRGQWLDRTGLYNTRRSKLNKDISEEHFMIDYEIQLSRPDCWAHLTQKEYREMIRQWTKEICETHKGQKFAGVKKVLDAEVYTMRTPKVGVRPLCKAGCIQLWIEFKKMYRAFRNQYYLASYHYHEACDACHGDGLIEARSLYPQGGFIHGLVPT